MPDTHYDPPIDDHEALAVRLERIESLLEQLVDRPETKEAYTTAEVAQILGRAEWTVRQWCRIGRVHACKRPSGRGPTGEWMIGHEELRRIQNEGLLPPPW